MKILTALWLGLKRPYLLCFAVASFLIFYATKIFAAPITEASPVAWGWLLIGLFGGLALFLYGMEKMSEGMKLSAGSQLDSVLGFLTRNRFIALVVGAVVTMVIQSSSATTVMLVSFVQAGLMNFSQTLGVILGADIGTTVTAQLIAFKFTDYALLMIAIGFFGHMFIKNEMLQHVCEAIMGFGILFFGMKLMSDAMIPMRTYPEFISIMSNLDNRWLALLFGAALTALIQSSSAFTGIVIVLAQQQIIGIDAGIPLILGANIGTCITAALASINTSREAKRVAIAHVLFKIAGVALFIWWTPYFADLVVTISVKLGMTDVARQIANAHTIFNVAVGFIFLPFTVVFGKFIEKIFPDKEEVVNYELKTKYLDQSSLTTPAVAIELARAETSHMAQTLHRMLSSSITPFVSEVRQDKFRPDLSVEDALHHREDKIDLLEEEIGMYLLKIGRQEITNNQADEVYALISIVKDMESIGDIIHRNILPLIGKKRALESDFSEEGKSELLEFNRKVCQQISSLQQAFKQSDHKKIKQIIAREGYYCSMEEDLRIKHTARLMEGRRESMATHEVHWEMMDLLVRVNVYACNMAKTILSIEW